MRLFSTLGRLPGTRATLAMSVFAGAAEGIGLTLFIPLLRLMSDEKSEAGDKFFELIMAVFHFLHIPVTVVWLLICIPIIILSSQALSYTHNVLLIKAQQGYARKVRETMVENLFRSQWLYLTEQSHGDIFNRLISETHRASHALRFEILSAGVLAQVLLFIGISFFLSPNLLIISIAFAVLVAIVVRPLHKRAKWLGEFSTEQNTKLLFHAIELLKGAKLIKSNAVESLATKRIDKHVSGVYEATVNTEVNHMRVYYIVQSLPVILLAVVLGVATEIYTIPVSSTLVFLIFMARIAPRIAQFQQFSQGYTAYTAGLSSVDQLLNESRGAREDMNPTGVSLRQFEQKIEFEDVTFSYPTSTKPVLKDISFSIRKNQIVAIVGRSGSGKSTLVDLLIGLHKPNSGRLSIDGISITDINLATWRQRIGYVSQDIVIFNDSVRNNILFANSTVDQMLINESMQLAHFSEVVEELPEGMETNLGEGGVRLSGGQKQRLSLARALVRQPDVLFLDEATSALDAESAHLIQSAIESIAHRMTIIIISHRPSTLRRADKIYVFKNGHIVEHGTYAELIKSGGHFKSLESMPIS
ncbi:MAG: hypothetical protein CMF69_06605 [Magnetovibrio sp.]|nr:hypothetical protein [Magnetovibrio sp.]